MPKGSGLPRPRRETICQMARPDDPDDGFGGLEEIFSGGTFMGMGM